MHNCEDPFMVFRATVKPEETIYPDKWRKYIAEKKIKTVFIGDDGFQYESLDDMEAADEYFNKVEQIKDKLHSELGVFDYNSEDDIANWVARNFNFKQEK